MPSQYQKIKRERFKKIAARRVQRILDDLDSLGKCANRNNYEYTQEEVEKMMREIRKKLRTIETLFKHNLRDKKKKPFKL